MSGSSGSTGPSSATGPLGPDTLTLLPAAPVAPAYLLIFDGTTAARVPLPPVGQVLIGRAPDVAISLGDGAASRRHARLDIGGGEVRVTDLDSHNGTSVNGERLSAPRVLLSGDVIAIGEATLVLHRPAPQRGGPPWLDLAQLRQRLDEELLRGLRGQRPVGLLSIQLAGPLAAPPAGAPAATSGAPGTTPPDGAPGRAAAPRLDRAAAQEAVSAQLGPIDRAAWGGASELLVLLPELNEDQLQAAAERLLSALAPLAPMARAGASSSPDDGCDGDALLTGARAAAAAAPPGALAEAAATTTTLRIGDRAVVVAEPAMVRLYALLERLARGALPVLVWGETGVGKELAAAALHHLSARRDLPLLAVNCAALPETLVESELFGHAKGAFTGAVSERRGLFESAGGGTVFLDEIGELSLPVQAKLLRLLEGGRFTRVGEVRERVADFRLVAATNRDLEEEVRAGRFRKDLLYRLNAAQVVIPPLRERRRELPVLARALLADACGRAGRGPMTLSAAAMAALLQYPWPGNVRELRNVMDYVASVAAEDEVAPWHLPEHLEGPARAVEPEPASGAPPGAAAPAEAPTAEPAPRSFRPLEEEVRELERARMLQALAAAGGVHRRAAELISMPRRTFASKVKLYGIRSPR